MSLPHSEAERLHRDGSGGSFRVERVAQADRTEAVRRLVAGGGEPQPGQARRFLEYADVHGVCLDWLWARRGSGGEVRHAVLVVPNPGRTAMVFASEPRSEAEVGELAEVLTHAARELEPAPVDLAQALLDPGEALPRRAFLRAGYTELANLSYLDRPLTELRRGPAPRWPEGITATAYDPSRRDELLGILIGSYEETLDCPGLGGMRRPEDILAGHQATGIFEPALWTILREGETGIGALLLNPSPDRGVVELVYLGLVKSARGRGLGALLLRHGLRTLAGRRERRITLAVDEANAPALRLYDREGFRRAARRVALVRSLRAPR
jgi:ribosomal protein S18 acetylase RimI-like enzyme